MPRKIRRAAGLDVPPPVSLSIDDHDAGEEDQRHRGEQRELEEDRKVLAVERHRMAQQRAAALGARTKRRSESRRAVRAVRRILGQRGHDEGAQPPRQPESVCGQIGRRRVAVELDELQRIARERRCAGEHAIGDDSETVDVGSGIDLVAATLFRRHVQRRAGHRSGLRHQARIGRWKSTRHVLRAWSRRRQRRRRFDAGQLGEAEVQHLHREAAAAIRLQPDVVRLEIAVHDAQAVGFGDGRTDLFEDVDHPARRQPSLLCQHVGKRTAVEVLHHQVRDLPGARRGEAEIGDVDDVGVAQAAGRFRFAPEPLDELGILREVRVDDLDARQCESCRGGWRDRPRPFRLVRAACRCGTCRRGRCSAHRSRCRPKR